MWLLLVGDGCNIDVFVFIFRVKWLITHWPLLIPVIQVAYLPTHSALLRSNFSYYWLPFNVRVSALPRTCNSSGQRPPS